MQHLKQCKQCYEENIVVKYEYKIINGVLSVYSIILEGSNL